MKLMGLRKRRKNTIRYYNIYKLDFTEINIFFNDF